jgi:hypothetical protein
MTATRDEAGFSPKVGFTLAAIVFGSLVLSFLLLVFRSEQLDEVTVDSDSYSVSALGHNLLVELLRETGRPVSRSRFQSGPRASQSLLLLAEPELQGDDDFEDLIAAAEHVLVVLPKRRGERDPEREHWIGNGELREVGEAAAVLRRLGTSGHVQRAPAPAERWSFYGDFPDLPSPRIDDLQVLLGSGFRPLIRSDQGTLLGAFQTEFGTVHVLADPDVIANHGIDDGDNAAFALGMLDALRDGRGIVVDETQHGFELAPSLWEELGRFPLALVLAHAFLLLFVVGWIGLRRFGPLTPPPPALPNDKQFLLDNTASLLLRGDHSLQAVRRYFRHRVRRTARRLGIEQGSDEQLTTALKARGAQLRRDSFAELCEAIEGLGNEQRSINPQQAVELARRIHQECEEIVHGSR